MVDQYIIYGHGIHLAIFSWLPGYLHEMWQLENPPFLDDFPFKTSI